LQDVFAFEIGVVGENLLNGMSGADLADNHAYGDPHAAYAWFSAHNGRVLRDAVKLRHVHLLAKSLRLSAR
jgi:hypothetical protein